MRAPLPAVALAFLAAVAVAGAPPVDLVELRKIAKLLGANKNEEAQAAAKRYAKKNAAVDELMTTFEKNGAVEYGIDRLLRDLSKRAPADSKMPSEEIGSIPAVVALVLEWTPAPKGIPERKWMALARLLGDESRRLQMAIAYKDAGLVQEQASRVKTMCAACHDQFRIPGGVPLPKLPPPRMAKGEPE